MHWLLQRRGAIGLTSPGRSLVRRLPHPVELQVLEASVERREVPGGGRIDVNRYYSPDESWIALSFDGDGGLAAERFRAEARRVISSRAVPA